MRRILSALVCAAAMLLAGMVFAEGLEPVDVQQVALEDGGYQIVRTYHVESDADGIEIPESFKEGGFRYTRIDTASTEITTEDTQEISVEESLSSSVLLTAIDFAETLDYEQDGYAGILDRNDATLTVAAVGTKNVSKTVTTTRKYSGLARNDMSALAQTYKGLVLISADWRDERTGQSVRGFTDGVPGPYSAVAYYRGVQTVKVPTEYEAKITYTGTVTKKTVAGKEIKVTYNGQPKKPVDAMFIAGVIFLLLCVIGGLAWLGIKKGVLKI